MSHILIDFLRKTKKNLNQDGKNHVRYSICSDSAASAKNVHFSASLHETAFLPPLERGCNQHMQEQNCKTC